MAWESLRFSLCSTRHQAHEPTAQRRGNKKNWAFFQPDLRDHECTGTGPIVTLSGQTYYRDIHLFTERIRDLVIVTDRKANSIYFHRGKEK